jgi:hypothetical protein
MSQSKSNNSKPEVLPKNLSKKGREKEGVWRFYREIEEDDEDLEPFWKEKEEIDDK